MACWSVRHDAQGNKIRYTADSGFGGKTLKYHDYGGDEARVLEAPLPANTTWAFLHDAAMAMIDSAEDKHHIFIESFEVDPDGQSVWIVTGS